MVFPFRRKHNSESLKLDAQRDFNIAVAKADDKSRAAKQFGIRIALQSRTCIDKLFVEAARKTELYEQESMAAITAGTDMPERPEVSCFQLIRVSEGYIHSYIPEKYAGPVFNLGAAYQTMKIDKASAVRRCQNIADALYEELGVTQNFEVLQFLRDEEEEVDPDQTDEVSGL